VRCTSASFDVRATVSLGVRYRVWTCHSPSACIDIDSGMGCSVSYRGIVRSPDKLRRTCRRTNQLPTHDQLHACQVHEPEGFTENCPHIPVGAHVLHCFRASQIDLNDPLHSQIASRPPGSPSRVLPLHSRTQSALHPRSCLPGRQHSMRSACLCSCTAVGS
jgi:hypothetical protein